MWESIWQGDSVHVWPLNDLLLHEVDCACLPVTEPVEGQDGWISWLVVHNSWDGRQ